MRKLYISVFGSGLGHATRMLPVARAARGLGWDVTLSSSGVVADHLRSQGFRCNTVPYVDVIYNNKTGSFSAIDTAKYFFPIMSRFAEQLAREAGNLSATAPDLIISDSAMASVIAGRLLGTRVITVLNQLRLESSPKTPRIFAKLLSSGSVAVGGELWGLSERVLIPDLPPPYTISERSLWSAGNILKKSRYIGFLTPGVEEVASDPVTARLSIPDEKKKPMVFWQISGPHQTRGPLIEKAQKMATSLDGQITTVISCGDPRGTTIPRRIPGGFVYEWCPTRDTLIRLADVVVSRAGHTSISQFIQRRKPSVLVPITSQSEQEGNASKAQSMGVAICLKEADLDLDRFLHSLETVKTQNFERRLAELSSFANRFDPLSSIVSLLGQ